MACLLGVLAIFPGVWAQAPATAGAAGARSPAPKAVTLTGSVRTGAVPLPGAAITLTDPATGKKYITSTDENGDFQAPIPHSGDYVISADFPDFAPTAVNVSVSPSGAVAPVQIVMTLAALAKPAGPTPAHAGGGTGRGGRSGTTGAANRGGYGYGRGSGRGAGTGSANSYQSVDLTADSELSGADSGEDAGATAADSGTVAGMATDTATETMTTMGSASAQESPLNAGMLQQGLQQIGAGPGGGDFYGNAGPQGGIAAGGQAPGGGFGGGGFAGGGRGGGGGGFGGGRGGRGGAGAFNMRQISNRFNQPHGNLSYQLSDSALNALPYSLTGVPATNVPNSAQQHWTATVTAPLVIPHLFNDNGKTSYTFTYSGTHNQTINTETGIVPTLDERQGEFADTYTDQGGQLEPVTVVNPQNGQPFMGDSIPMGDQSLAAQGLLNYIPLPNVACPAADTAAQCSTLQNYTNTVRDLTSGEQVNLRINHVFTTPQRGRGGRGGGRGGRGGRGASMNFSLAYNVSNTTTPGLFPSVEGIARTTGLNATLGFNLPVWGWINNFSVTYNASTGVTNNLYAYNTNVLGELGITGTSQAPIAWGLPTLDFTDFTGLSDTTPVNRHAQTFTTTDGIVRRIGRHTLRIGGDARRIQNDPAEENDPRGTFTFTGLYSGYDFADFLLGDAEETQATYGGGTFYFRQNSDDLYFQDNWQARGNFTLNWGVRWEYLSPMTEKYGRMTNLAIGPDFSTITPVTTGTPGWPSGMIFPEEDAIAPRLGFAWKTWNKMVVMGGYGINYNTQTFSGLATALAYQPPYVTNVTNIGTSTAPLSLSDGFAASSGSSEIENNFSVNPDYRMGYVQIWDAALQRQIGRTYLLNLDYTGTKGTDLNQLRAPNRTPTGLLWTYIVPFYYDTSGADSTYNGGSVIFSRRLSQSMSWRAAYTYSKAITDASSVGTSGGLGGVVAQNDLDLDAEKALASFDERQKVNASYEWQFPFGQNHRWGDHNSFFDSVAGDWELTGSYSFHTGMPLTPVVSNTADEVFQGISGSLRPNVVAGETVSLPHPTQAEFFNIAAFSIPPTGSYGDAGPYTITGPAQQALNAALDKTFRVNEFQSLNIRISATNVLNHPEFSGINTTVNSPLFGQVTSMAAMRSLQLVVRYRF